MFLYGGLMKKSDILIFKDDAKKNVEAIAKLIKPFHTIIGDKEVLNAAKGGGEAFITAALEKHPNEVIDVLATCEGKDPEEYKATLPHILEVGFMIMSDKDLMALFTPQG